MKNKKTIEQLKEIFSIEQELDIPMKDRFHNQLSIEQISELTCTKGSYPAEPEEIMKKNYNKMFMDIALLTANQSNCVKYKVGCVVVLNDRVILQGYNGTVKGFINCSEKFKGLDINLPENRKLHSEWSNAFEVHAEMNVITYAAKKGIQLNNTKVYITHKPCNNCLKHLISSGVNNIVYLNDYNDINQQNDIKEMVKLIKINKA